MDFLKALFGGSGDSDFSQAENEALVDLLLLASYADKHISMAESDRLQTHVDSLEWKSGTSLDLYMSGAKARARDASSNPEREAAFLAKVNDRFTSSEAKAKALDLLQSLFDADGIAERETEFIARAHAVLGG